MNRASLLACYEQKVAQTITTAARAQREDVQIRREPVSDVDEQWDSEQENVVPSPNHEAKKTRPTKRTRRTKKARAAKEVAPQGEPQLPSTQAQHSDDVLLLMPELDPLSCLLPLPS
jgi:hypothetical protein